MQTFLPSKNFDVAANMLDSKRLNKQILESYQILKVLSMKDPKAAWRNHPAVKMWRDHEHGLFTYTLAMVNEANKRGIKTDKNMENLLALRIVYLPTWGHGFPKWFSNAAEMKKITTTHRARLYVKDPEHYFEFKKYIDHPSNKPCCEGCNYYWPTHIVDKVKV